MMNARPYGIEETLAALARDRAEFYIRLMAEHGLQAAAQMIYFPEYDKAGYIKVPRG